MVVKGLVANIKNQVAGLNLSLESLILAQNERWQRGLGMQVERESIYSIFGKKI